MPVHAAWDALHDTIDDADDVDDSDDTDDIDTPNDDVGDTD